MQNIQKYITYALDEGTYTNPYITHNIPAYAPPLRPTCHFLLYCLPRWVDPRTRLDPPV